MDQRPFAVIDIDGVLADVRHRLRFVAERPKDWKRFFAAAPQDPPLRTGVDAVHNFADAYRVVYSSGRPEFCRRDTEAWLRRHGLPAGDLLLRPEGDRRPARLVKVEALRRLSRDAEVAVVVDDDAEVVAAVRAAGFDVVHATWMSEDAEEQAALRRAQEVDGRT